MHRCRFVALLASTVLALAAATAQGQTVKVGSKNFTEQSVLAEIYAAALENGGVKVERKINLGGTMIAHQALVTGEIDLYPEYTGTAVIAVMKGAVSGGPEKVYDQVKEFYEKQYKVTWLNPTAIDNGYVLTVRQDTADRYALKTLSDLGKVAGALTLGAGPEFADRRDGIPGLKAVYGVEFKEFKQFAKLGLRYDALSGKQIDVANGFATDWQLGEQKLVTLEDDKHLFQPYLVAPVVRLDVLAQNPKIADILNKVSALLDNKTIQTLNARVEQNHEDAADVADDFLKAKGLVN